MPSLKTLKTRISSIKSSQKITKAMKLIAASRLKRSKQKLGYASVYADKLDDIMANLYIPQNPELKQADYPGVKVLLIPITSNRGLCGGFNASIIKYTKAKVAGLLAEGKQVEIITIGRKGLDALRAKYSNYITESLEEDLGVKDIRALVTKLLDMRNGDKLDVCEIIYSRFHSAISQIPDSFRLIPYIDSDNLREYDCEPNQQKVLEHSVIVGMVARFYKIFVESMVSENASRMSAMDNATRNADKILKELNLQYNRTRQSYITKELIEIISGAQAT